jgi:hypothetical protein
MELLVHVMPVRLCICEVIAGESVSTLAASSLGSLLLAMSGADAQLRLTPLCREWTPIIVREKLPL